MDKAAFVQKVKMLCLQKGVKPTNACKECGIGGSFLSDISSRGQIPSVERVQKLAAYLGVTTSELLGEAPAGSAPAGKAELQAAFWGGEADLSQEDLDAMWGDVERFAQFLAERKRQEKQSSD